jgi:hypothetical protein
MKSPWIIALAVLVLPGKSLAPAPIDKPVATEAALPSPITDAGFPKTLTQPVRGISNTSFRHGQKIWWWFDDCPDGQAMGIEVILDGKSIYHSELRICQMYREDADRKPNQKTTVFNLSGGHNFQGGYSTKTTEQIEGNIWQAGADPNDILLGLSFSNKRQILLNTVHIMEPTKTTESEIDLGLIVRTYPLKSPANSVHK